MKDHVRVVIPDSHGSHIDPHARAAFLKDLKLLDPRVIVMLGDHVDTGGMYDKHPRQALEDIQYSYYEDVDAANSFLDDIQRNAPHATEIHYLEGNHEYHVERWAVDKLGGRDAARFVDANAPHALLRLKQRGIKFYRRMAFYQGLSIPNTIRLGECFFTHGISASKHATATHVTRFGACVQHGHTHRAQEYRTRTVRSPAIGGWCPGTLSRLQPTYAHTNLTEWSHGYGVDFVSSSGRFSHINAAIVNGQSMMRQLLTRCAA